MKRALLFLVSTTVLAGLAFGGASCGGKNDVRHSDYGACDRTGRHKHNDHVFIGGYHDHSLCEWAKYE